MGIMPAMATPLRRIGILTAGGDCPGLNAVIRAVTRSAVAEGLEVFGIESGFLGLIENRISPLGEADVSGILARGGTILGSHNKCNPAAVAVRRPDGSIATEDRRADCLKNIEAHGLDALVVVGGDGSMSCAARFIEQGVPCVGVPKTIDNDLVGTEVTFGFATAVHVATEALDRVHTTASSHHRVMLVELMGRNAGWLTLHAGIASGADIVLLPEIPYRLEALTEKIQSRRRNGKGYTLVAVGEGAKPVGGSQTVRQFNPLSPDPVRLGGVATVLAEQLETATGIETRATVLGYVQRGGTPVADDRVLGTRFGHAAVGLLARRAFNRLVVQQQGAVTDIPLVEAADRQRTIPADHPMLAAARAVGTSLGDRA